MERGAPPTRRRTKIVATIGPASGSRQMLLALAGAGMDAARAGVILTGLELGGLARQLGGQRWIAVGARSGGA